MGEISHIYIFGDETFDYSKHLHYLVHHPGDPLVASFFDKTYYALRAEIGTLPQRQQKEFKRFANFPELSAQKLEGLIHPSLDQALSCAYQLARFISKYGQEWSYPKAANSYIIGVCSGALAAAAVCSSTTFSNLLSTAVHSVVVSFRTGLRSVEACVALGSSKDYQEDWSMLVPRLQVDDVNQEIESFSNSKHLPSTSRPFVSASSDAGVTISAPPSTLKSFHKNPPFNTLHCALLPLKSPYHAPHLFTEEDVNSILSITSTDDWATRFAAIPAISSSTGDLIRASNFHCLLCDGVSDILIRPLRWDKICQRLQFIASSTRGMPIVVHQIGLTADNTIRTALQDGGCELPLILDQSRSLLPSDLLSSSALKLQATNQNLAGNDDKAEVDRSKIAIVGSSGRFPDAEDLSAYWKLLYEGRDVHKEVPPLHWDIRTHVDPTGKTKNTSATPYGCWLDRPELFDAKFFNISPREAPQVDPAQRIALLTAYEAMEQAGIVPGATPSTQKDRVGVFYGVTSNDWMETNSAQNIDAYHIPGGNRAFIPGRINYFFNFSGPSFSIDTACSSSLASIHVACNALWRGEIDTAITGGTNILTNPDFTAGLDRGHFLSRTGNCKTFDDGADGYCRGEGVGTVILKRLQDAISDGDPVVGVISGAYTNHSAEAESITRPHVGAQEDIFRKILHGAGVDPYDVGYVEMHGTGTQAGDGSEMRSVMGTFAPSDARQRRTEEQNLYIGSAKANIGHGEAASGVSSLIKVLLMMEKSTIPPHCGIKTRINHTFPTNLQERRVFIADKPTPWKRPGNNVRKAFINNFSAAGGNTALLLEDAPVESLDMSHDPRSTHLVAVSAKSASSLQGNLHALISALGDFRPEDFSRLSWTTTARRIHHQHRVMVHGQDLQAIRSNLQRALDAKEGSKRPASAPKVAFVFTGQGSGYAGMGRDLFRAYSCFRNDIMRFEKIVMSLGFPSFLPFLTAIEGEAPEPAPIVSQLAIVCLEIALARLWISWGIAPQSAIGHSLGYYAALNVTGVLSDADTIHLVGKRAQLLQSHCPPGTHSMLAVRTNLRHDSNAITKILKGKKYEIACINSPEEFVIGGSGQEIRGAHQRLSDSGVKATMLNVPYAFHSAQVEPILSEFEQAAQSVSFHDPAVPLLNPLDASVISQGGIVSPRHLSQQCRQTVDFVGAVDAAKTTGIVTEKSIFLELGPHPVVSGMIKAMLPTASALASLKRKSDIWQVIAQTMSSLYTAGADVQWREYHRDFKSCQKVLRLPAYSWDLKGYWMQYVHDWSLRKGDPPLVTAGSLLKRSSGSLHPPPKEIAPPKVEIPRLESTTIHSVIEETMNGKQGCIKVRSDISRSDLNPLVQGHKVDGVPLCTPSVYADMGLSLGDYIRRRYWTHLESQQVVVADMVIEKALIAAPKGPQLLQANVELNGNENTARCSFHTANGKSKMQHAACTLRFSDPQELQNLQRQVSTVRTRLAGLRKKLETQQTYIFNKAMIYKMIATLAAFDPNYRALDEIVLDSAHMEASSIASFGGMKNEGEFYTNPGYIDALSQSAGFVMNANEKSNLDVEVFVNHGWESFQLFEVLSPAKKYETHVAMSEGAGKMWHGDVLVLDGDTIVASFKGIMLQGVARRLLRYILSTESNAQTGTNKPKDSSVAPKQAGSTPPQDQEAKKTLSQPSVQDTPTNMPKPASVPIIAKARPSTPTQAAAPSKKASPKKPSQTVTKALKIVAEESEIDTEDLTDDAVLGDIGIDSLLGLMISSRFRDEIGVDIDSSTLHGLSTVKGLKYFLRRDEAAGTGEEEAKVEEVPVASAVDADDDQSSLEHHIAKPKIAAVITEQKPNFALQGEQGEEDSNVTSELFGRVLQIIAEEGGIDIESLNDDTVFADAGIDSLLSLMISSRLRDELNIEAAAENMLFTTCNTLKDLRIVIEPTAASSVAPSTIQDYTAIEIGSVSSSSDTDQSSITMNSDNDTPSSPVDTPKTPPDQPVEIAKVSAQLRKATSVILQGRPWASSKTLFLFPDGAGSASSYANLPKIHPDLAVLALNCPFVRHPQEMTCTLDELMQSYFDEVKRRQPTGPYNFGGWSAGGILAYRAAQILIQQGEEVERLVLIDSPVPKGLDRLPQRFYDHLATIDLFGKAMPGSKNPGPPSHLFEHFNATIEVLHGYHAKALPANALKRVTILWATEPVTDGIVLPKLPPKSDDTEGMKFLTEKRTDFSAQGWGELFPSVKIDVRRVEDAHHFSMMVGYPTLPKETR
ncbi:MAG: hypothetical protein Q9225_005573 [Loekoesia sp. 1 TL-2023]